MNKKDLTEQEIRTRYITPAIQGAGWQPAQIREEVYITDGQIHPRGKVAPRGKRKFADYVLYHHNLPFAIVEAKDNNHPLGGGMQQALEYAGIWDVPFAYSSNGDGFLEHNLLATSTPGEPFLIEVALPLEQFPSPEELWARYRQGKAITPLVQDALDQPYYYEFGGKTPRYYQQVAVNRTLEAIARGQDRILLVMATGTGKTYVAFQIIWRLWKAGLKKRILFLADRNILVDQAKDRTFTPFGDALHKIQRRPIKSREVYFAINRAGPRLPRPGWGGGVEPEEAAVQFALIE
jgi:type I restriction enzyme R subunit